MSKPTISVGTIIKDVLSNKKYRVIAITQGIATLCEMDITDLRLRQFEALSIVSLIESSDFIEEHENTQLFDVNGLSKSIRERYEMKLQMVNEIHKIYGPTYMELDGHKTKPEVKEIMSKFNLSKSTFWRTVTKYLQSGMKNVFLVDEKAFGVSKGKKYQYSKKPGRKPTYICDAGILITPEIKEYFKNALDDYKSGRQKSIRSAFNKMSALHFQKTDIVNGRAAIVLLPQSERPTYRQFYNYVSKELSTEEKDRIKTSAMEQRNNKRLLLSDSLEGVYGPGDMVEIDACEADVSLVSSFDRNQSIGRPIVYFMIDVYTRVILAVSVAFDNNSVLGVTNLFLNLMDDKQEFCNRYGMGFDNPMLWPSNIIPRRIRIDRGSEFKSKEFNRICVDLGIEKQIVPGGSGSLKGVVEQAFHQMHAAQNMHLENYGLIEKRHDSNHHKEATLDIEQYTKMVINFILAHNQQYFERYPLTKDMREKKIKPIPALLWQYGIKQYGAPRPIVNKEQYLYNLMTPIKAKISRQGITYKDLWYLPDNDPQLARDMFHAGNKKITFEVRIDMRSIGCVYYLRDGKLIKAPLNARRTGNSDFSKLTMKQWDDLRKAKFQMDAEGRIYNEEIAAFTNSVNASVVDSAKKKTYSDSKNMRPSREDEKQLVSWENNIEQRLQDIASVTLKETEVNHIETNNENSNQQEEQQKSQHKEYQSWEEALEDFWNNY